MWSSKTNAVLVWLSCVYAFYHFVSTLNGDWHFIDNVNLIIHEAGHIVFIPFGEFFTALGGSLLQVLVPIMFMVYFYRARQFFAQAIMFLWTAVSLFHVGLYASDSVKMELPLLGGEGVSHDWNYLLMQTGLISYTKQVSDFIFFLGLLCVALAAYTAYLHYNDSLKKPASNLR